VQFKILLTPTWLIHADVPIPRWRWETRIIFFFICFVFLSYQRKQQSFIFSWIRTIKHDADLLVND